MTIKQLKKELGLNQKDLAEFFGMSYGAFANSTAKNRYEKAIIKFYKYINEKNINTYLQNEVVIDESIIDDCKMCMIYESRNKEAESQIYRCCPSCAKELKK